MAIALHHQRLQCVNLALGPQHRFVGFGEVFEVRIQVINTTRNVKSLQHVGTHKLGQAAHRFHRHRLVKQLERLLTLNAEAISKAFTVLSEGVENGYCRAILTDVAQSLPQQFNVSAEICEVVHDGHAPVGHHEQPRGRCALILDPKHLR